MTHHLDLGHVFHPYADHMHERPARQCHCLRRAKDKETAAEADKMSETVNPESEVVAVEKPADASEAVEVDNNENVEAKLCDEFCPDTEYVNNELDDDNSVIF